MNEMIKRCKQAIHDLFPGGLVLWLRYGADDDEMTKDEETELIRTILLAMREPTTEMLAKAIGRVDATNMNMNTAAIKKALSTWQAMIDKALE